MKSNYVSVLFIEMKCGACECGWRVFRFLTACREENVIYSSFKTKLRSRECWWIWISFLIRLVRSYDVNLWIIKRNDDNQGDVKEMTIIRVMLNMDPWYNPACEVKLCLCVSFRNEMLILWVWLNVYRNLTSLSGKML